LGVGVGVAVAVGVGVEVGGSSRSRRSCRCRSRRNCRRQELGSGVGVCVGVAVGVTVGVGVGVGVGINHRCCRRRSCWRRGRSRRNGGCWSRKKRCRWRSGVGVAVSVGIGGDVQSLHFSMVKRTTHHGSFTNTTVRVQQNTHPSGVVKVPAK
jgi:hypothetical protein